MSAGYVLALLNKRPPPGRLLHVCEPTGSPRGSARDEHKLIALITGLLLVCAGTAVAYSPVVHYPRRRPGP